MKPKLTPHQRELATEILGTLQTLLHRAYERLPVPDGFGNEDEHPILIRVSAMEREIDQLRDAVYREEY